MSQPFPPRGDKSEIESGLSFTPKFDSNGLIPAVVQDHADGRILMVAYMNAESLQMTLDKQETVFYSRSRQELWHKGQTSGNTQKVKEILVDCDQDCLVIKVEQIGGAACHTGEKSCFYRTIADANTLLSNTKPTTQTPKKPTN